MQRFKIPITLILLISMVLPFVLNPRIANAQLQDRGFDQVLVGGISCTAGGLVAGWIVSKLFDWFGRLQGTLGNTLRNFLGINSLLNTFVPTHDSQFQAKVSSKEDVMDVVARCFARAVLNDLTARMIGAARTSGRDSTLGQAKPAFVRDWRKFLSNAQYRGENLFRSILSSTTLCDHFAGEMRTLFRANNQPNITRNTNIRVGNLDPFTLRGRCTMAQGWTIQKYANDFAGNGGYGALTRLAEPQNNAYGALLLSLGELAAQRAIEEMGDNSEVVSNDGFESRRGKPGNNCLIRTANSQCIVYKEILTPGSVLQKTVAATIQQELAWIGNVDEWQELISYLMNTVMSRILNLSEPSNYDQEPFPRENYPGNFDDPTGDINGTIPPPPTGGFCSGTDQDGDGAICDIYLGEDETTCPAECAPLTPPQCQDGQDNDNDGLFDANGVSPFGTSPDPGCTDPFDSSEDDSVATAQCNDGVDNEGDYLVDFTGGPLGQPADPDCSSPTDNSEVSFVITLCANVSINPQAQQPCQQFVSSLASLAGTAVGDNNASYMIASAILFQPAYVVELCLDPDYGQCTTITASMLSSGAMNLSAIGYDNNVSSLRISQPGPLPPPPAPLPPPPPGSSQSDTLSLGQSLFPGQQLTSQNGLYTLVLQGDGNLVLYDSNGALWSTGTVGSPPDFLVIDGGGNLILYSGGTPSWQTSTSGGAGTFLVIQNDSNLVLYDGGGNVLWTR